MRKTIFADSQFYHIYNRTVAKQSIFRNARSIKRMLGIINYYRFPVVKSYSLYLSTNESDRQKFMDKILSSSPIVEIHAFSLMPNHYHFILKQRSKNGIISFISNMQNSFARYFNTKNKRVGALFCHPFKGVHIVKDEVFTHVARYIHLNPVTSYLINIETLTQYPNTSFSTYLGNQKNEFLTKDTLLGLYGNKLDLLKENTFDQSNYQKTLHELRNIIEVQS